MTVLHFFFGFSCRAFLDLYCIFYLVSMLAIKMIVFLFFFHFFQWGREYGYEPQSIYEHKNRHWFLNKKNLIKPFVPDHLYIYLYFHLVEKLSIKCWTTQIQLRQHYQTKLHQNHYFIQH